MGRILGSIGEEGRLEEMCEAAGLVPGERRFVRFDVEMGPEVEDLVRASISPGATYIAVKERGLDSGVTIYTLSEMAPPGLTGLAEPHLRAGCGGRPAGHLLKFSYETRQDDDKPRYSQDSSKCVDAIEGLEIAPDAEAHKEHRVGNPIGD